MSFEVFPVLWHTVWRYIDVAWSTRASSGDRQEVLVSTISCKVGLCFRNSSFFQLTAIFLDEVDYVVICRGTKYMRKSQEGMELTV